MSCDQTEARKQGMSFRQTKVADQVRATFYLASSRKERAGVIFIIGANRLAGTTTGGGDWAHPVVPVTRNSRMKRRQQLARLYSCDLRLISQYWA